MAKRPTARNHAPLPPADMVCGADLLKYAPLDLNELAVWLTEITPDQARAVGIAAIVDGVTRPGWSLGELTRALLALDRIWRENAKRGGSEKP